MRFDELHEAFEAVSPDGIGYAVGLPIIQGVARIQLKALEKPAPGVNCRIPLTPIDRVESGFTPASGSFVLNPANGYLSLDLNVYLHVAGYPERVIANFTYEAKNAATRVVADQVDMRAYLEPATGAGLTLKDWKPTGDADGYLIDIGYVVDEKPDRERFKNEVIYPFIWINGRGLLRAIFRSIPLPQLFPEFHLLKPVAPIEGKIVTGHLMVWSKKALVDFKSCDAPLNPQPKATAFEAEPNVSKPWSPMEDSEPKVMTYHGAVPLLDWYAAAVRPAIGFHQEQEGVIGWRVDATLMIDAVKLVLHPSSDGGSVIASLKLLSNGSASAWFTGPCDVRAQLASAGFGCKGSSEVSLTAAVDAKARQIRTEWTIKTAIDPGSVTLNSTFPGFTDIVAWLVRSGALKVDLSFVARGQQVLLDLSNIAPPYYYSVRRVSEKSMAITLFEG